jgi:hypothetical protein
VLKVATMPEYRRLGLARRLMALAEEHVVEMSGESLTLEVRVSNTEAIALYEALDYKKAGERPGRFSLTQIRCTRPTARPGTRYRSQPTLPSALPRRTQGWVGGLVACILHLVSGSVDSISVVPFFLGAPACRTPPLSVTRGREQPA